MTSPNADAVGNGSARMSPLTNRTFRSSRPRLTRCRALASIGVERSIPTTGTPARPSGTAIRPVPHPSSSTGAATRFASSRQNGTSRRPIVRAFSQS